MKTEHKIYAGLAILAMLAGGLYLTSQNKKEQSAKHSVTAASADMPPVGLPKDDADKITKIEIATTDKDDKTKRTKVTLEKKGEDWEVTAPVQAKANGSNVKSLIDNLKELKVKEQIDHGATSFDGYELSDEKAVHVVAYKGDGKATDLYFGKSGSRGQMMRVAGKDGVFVLSSKPGEAYSSYLYTRDVKGWRDGAMLKFEDANAIQVDVTNKNGQFSFSKNGDKWSGAFTKRDKDGKLDKPEKEWKKFDEGKVKDLLRAYKALTAEDYGEAKDKAQSGLDKPEENGGVIHVKLKDNAGDLTIKVGKVSKGTSRWAMKDGGDILYAISSWAADWATAEPAKFEKGDDKKDDKKGDKDKSPPPPPPPSPGGGEGHDEQPAAVDDGRRGMKASYRWLCALLPELPELSARRSAVDRLSNAAGSAGRRQILEYGEGTKDIVVAEVRRIEAHPSRPKLQLVTVDRGGGNEQRVVCGAPNVPAPGGRVALAPLGTTLPAVGDHADAARDRRRRDRRDALLGDGARPRCTGSRALGRRRKDHEGDPGDP